MRASELKPGSDEAFAQGCICPRVENGYGRGYLGGVKDEEGNTVYVYVVGCPVHDERATEEEAEDE